MRNRKKRSLDFIIKDETFFSSVRKLFLAAPLIFGIGCGGTVYVEAPPSDTRITGSTEKLQYKVGEEVGLHGPLSERSTSLPELTTEEEGQGRIRLISRNFTPDRAHKAEAGLKEKATAGRVHALMQYSPDDREKLQEQGIEFLSYIPDDTWVVSMPTGLIKKLDTESNPNLEPIKWVGEIQTQDKLSPLVRERKIGRWNTTEEGDTGLIVKFYKDVPLDEGVSLVEAYNGEVMDTIGTINSAVVNVRSLDDFLEIAEHNSVAWIEFPRPLSGLNYNARAISGVDEIQECWTGYTGVGIVAGVYDSGTVCEHEDFDTRLTIGEGETKSCRGHATHVAGSVAGSGLMTEEWASTICPELQVCDDHCVPKYDCSAFTPMQFRGMMPSAEIVSYAYSGCKQYCLHNTPGDIEDDYGKLINLYGVHFITNSIGSNGCYNGYPEVNGVTDTTAVQIDTIILENGILVLYAAGNERGYWCEATYDTIGAPAAGMKNGFVIGATDAYDNVTDFTSWGPTKDGRIGITVCMHGKDVMSTYDWNIYGELSGTSMGTPEAAGTVGLLTQPYIEIHNERPVPPLLKAVVANTAADVGPEGIDYQCGFGRVDAVGALEHILEGRTIEGTIDSKEQEQYTLKLDEQADLKVTIAWTDTPGDPMAAKQLVNDLDIELTAPDGTKHLPKHLDPNNPEALATEGPDHLNNMEQIHVTNAEPGTYTLTVKANKLPEEKQAYIIAHGPAQNLEEALLVNNSEKDYEGYVHMEVYGTNACGEGIWSKLETVVDDKGIDRVRYLKADTTLPLYEIWRGNGGFTPTMPGYYRIHAEFRDKNGKVYETKSGLMKRDFFFTVVETDE